MLVNAMLITSPDTAPFKANPIATNAVVKVIMVILWRKIKKAYRLIQRSPLTRAMDVWKMQVNGNIKASNFNRLESSGMLNIVERVLDRI